MVLHVESGGVLPTLAVRDHSVAPSTVIGPAMVAADMVFLPPLLERADDGASVPAGVEEGIDLSRTVAGEEDGLAPDIGGNEIVWRGDLVLQPDEDPGALEDPRHLQLEHGGVAEDVAMDAEYTLGRPVLDQVVRYAAAAHPCLPSQSRLMCAA